MLFLQALCLMLHLQVSWRSAHEDKKSVFSAAVIAAVEEANAATPPNPQPTS